VADVPGSPFRRINDAEGDSGAFLVMLMESETRPAAIIEGVKIAGLQSLENSIVSRYNFAVLRPAIRTLAYNAQSVYSYAKGTCP
jgi:hypothetical protein